MIIDDTLIKSILILAANPKGTSKLRLDEEVREIDLGLRCCQKREQFVLKTQWAVRPRDIYRAILDFRPQIVHFCGHGDGKEGLVFEDESGLTKLVSSESLANLFKLFVPHVECVFLNACYSEIQAQAISQHIDYVIGMKQGIGDKAAINFTVGFYDALGAGKSYDFAFNLGCVAIQIAGICEESTPVIKKKITMTNEQLQQLIARIYKNSDVQSPERLKAISRLLSELQQFPGLLKSSHPLYLEALDQTWEWVIKNICKFKPKSHIPISKSLVIWINGYLYWRIKDLYLNQQRQSCQEDSLDFVINPDSENPLTLLDKISETGFSPLKLSGLEAYLEQQRIKNIQEIWQKFERYVEEDPERLLRSCHPRKYPDCNCQLLAKKLFLKDPPELLSQIHREFQNSGVKIPDQTLRSHCKNKCLPLLQKILESLGYSEEEKS